MSTPSKRERLRHIVVLRVSTASQAVDGYGLPARERDHRWWNGTPGHEHAMTYIGPQMMAGEAAITKRRAGAAHEERKAARRGR
ncbi:hypothetical protein [Streptomyces gardneri]|uniref:Uncharacterized protein n=1 Tax=Streptomyces gardneri TaxID=66892 RepID=A0A4Y3RWQ5_9ACTN|nr:hypothetical protein [Streptomyces gardneri]GEB62361.1 hypothetical protein SGA01_79660 [Streptomyces gardneri]GHH24316.1 hypothetical protein GCM10017674_81640 [Streptomyces gardneri]